MIKTGTVKWFNRDKGFGFITSDNKDIFVHYTDIEDDGFKTLIDGQHVEFEVVKGDRGEKAKNVKIVPQGNK